MFRKYSDDSPGASVVSTDQRAAEMSRMKDDSTPFWRNRSRLAFAVFLAIGGYFLWTEHQAHVIEFLPWLLILGCVGMHFFMHGGHGGGNRDGGQSAGTLPKNDGENKR